MQKYNRTKKAFTLLELIVAMAIIAVLMGLSLYGIQTVQRSQRDTERRAALQNINLELAGYYGDVGQYPAYPSIFKITAAPCTGSTVGGCAIIGSKTIVLKGAADPIVGATQISGTGGTAYCYVAVGGGTSYQLGVNLEGSGWGTVGTAQQLGNDKTACGSNVAQ